MSACIIIPARYESSRFPGKPLAMINGKPMIHHVIDGCRGAVENEHIIVATDDTRISDCVAGYGCRVVMVDGEIKTGSDRIAEVARNLDYDVIIGVQGDEPLVKAEDILKVIEFKRIKHDSVINCYSITKETGNPNTIKVVTHGIQNDELIYMSRNDIPSKNKILKRQVCIYGWYKEQLLSTYGADKGRGGIEQYEDVEILRCFNNRQKVFMLKLNGVYQSVDIKSDVEKVEEILNNARN